MASQLQIITRRYNWLKLRIAGSANFFVPENADELITLLRRRLRQVSKTENLDEYDILELQRQFQFIRTNLLTIESILQKYDLQFNELMQPIRAEKKKAYRKGGDKYRGE